MDIILNNVQKHHSFTHLLVSQTFRSYLHNQYGPGVYPNFRKFGPEIASSSIDWAQLSRFYLKTETESSHRNVVF
jgi:hypothetical protein